MPPSVHSPVRSQPLSRAANVQSPVRSQRLSKYADSAFLDGNSNTSTKIVSTRRRRVFVQTETGNVLGMELGRGDNVHTIKKRIQNLLYIPMEQADLVCGDTVLKNNINELRNNTPLLLSTGLQRSLSTPCISPSLDLQIQRSDADCSVEVVGGLSCCTEIKMVIKEIVEAIDCRVYPISVSGGLGGAYYFRNRRGDNVAILKPTDEEPLAPNNPKGFVGNKLGMPGLKRGIRVGETGVREVAAFLLDHGHFAKVPPTVLVKVHHSVFSSTSTQRVSGELRPLVSKIASCQKFVYHDFDASDRGSSCFPVSAVHRIGILDVRIFNTDRHAGNILIKEVEPSNEKGGWGYCISHPSKMFDLIPIDHGLCLPESLEDPYFEWLHWPQASLPFSEDELEYIKQLDVDKDVDMLRMKLPMLREACLRVLVLSTTLLQEAATAGFCLAEIGALMTRDGMGGCSELEVLCMQAKQQMEKELSGVVPDGYVRVESSPPEEDSAEQFELEIDEGSRNVSSDRRKRPGIFQVISTDGENFKPLFQYKDDSNYKSQSSQSPSILSGNAKIDGTKIKCQCSNASSIEYCHKEVTPQENRSFWGTHLRSLFFWKSSSKRSASCIRGPPSSSSSCKCSLQSTLSSAKDIGGEQDVSQRAIGVPIKAKPGKKASIHNFRRRALNNPDNKTLRLKVNSTPETLGKVEVAGGVAALSFGEMTEEEWACFIDWFQELLSEALTAKRSEQAGYRQRLGVSCRF